ncbi:MULTISPECIES: peptidylprolyl isomerase [unclassified Minwuia]|jgi:peptidyl-prolyl cis-trans isomerase C|uniref:peptidylprolyl isomerase n=1 Tax=unclassified Minwuia TaxID=2618799 RepID=UPI0024788DB5|nr:MULTISPECIES: peptidylprolyl isomerase [unclassified Minwuia]
MLINHRHGLALVLGLALTAPAALAQTTTAPTPAAEPTEAEKVEQNPVVARVNGEEIRLEAVMSMIQDLPPQYQQVPISTLYPMLVKRAVNHSLLLDAAEAAGLRGNEKLEAEVEEFRQNKMREYLLLGQLEKDVTEEALRAAYARFLVDNPATQEIRARHILLKTEDEAKAVIAELQGGADFAELAKAKSQGPSAPTGGDLGFFTADKMVKPFSDAAYKMAEQEISAEPVQTRFGWHVIKVEERRDQPRPTFEEKRQELEQEMTGEMIGNIIADLRKDAKIEELNLDGSPLTEPGQPAAPKE